MAAWCPHPPSSEQLEMGLGTNEAMCLPTKHLGTKITVLMEYSVDARSLSYLRGVQKHSKDINELSEGRSKFRVFFPAHPQQTKPAHKLVEQTESCFMNLMDLTPLLCQWCILGRTYILGTALHTVNLRVNSTLLLDKLTIYTMCKIISLYCRKPLNFV